ncbi:MAG: hypothetical protein EOM20_12900 [Spartobacteria bacterium]|nr:hypothetical protein [Spartobacteria bacterium]
MKAVTMTICAVLLFSLSVQANEIIELNTSDKTSPNIPLKFETQLVIWDGAGVKIDGKVTNCGQETYDTIRVVFTLKNAQGNMLIATQTENVQPQKLAPGETGALTPWIECHGTQPAQMDVNVTAVKLMP